MVFNAIKKNGLCLVVVKRTFESEYFQYYLNKIPANKLMFIGDECHGHASAEFANLIPNCAFKMGLSATPEHYRNVNRNKILLTLMVVQIYNLLRNIA